EKNNLQKLFKQKGLQGLLLSTVNYSGLYLKNKISKNTYSDVWTFPVLGNFFKFSTLFIMNAQMK
ncbi:hypothetical protein P6Z26_12285, partial [Enterococcus faecium]|uniref:hypothetical protein n=1 Tax=Enterococcus faecium TaxID=1352 RepID=UPI0028907E95